MRFEGRAYHALDDPMRIFCLGLDHHTIVNRIPRARGGSTANHDGQALGWGACWGINMAVPCKGYVRPPVESLTVPGICGSLSP